VLEGVRDGRSFSRGGESAEERRCLLKYPAPLTIYGVGRQGVGSGPNTTNVIKEMNAWDSQSTTT
jgi:hypothetical protein